MSSQPELETGGEIGNIELDVVSSTAVRLDSDQKAAGQHSFQIEGFDGEIFSQVNEPIVFEEKRRLHLFELEKGVAVTVLPDFERMRIPDLRRALQEINLRFSRENLWDGAIGNSSLGATTESS